MALSALGDKSREPDEAILTEVLGRSKGLWDAVLAYLAQEYPGVQNEWGFAGAKYGRSLRSKHKKRTILYLIPQKEPLLAAIVLGERAVAAAEESTHPAHILEAIRSARRYAEGRGIRFEVRRPDDIHVIQELTRIKMTHEKPVKRWVSLCHCEERSDEAISIPRVVRLLRCTAKPQYLVFLTSFLMGHAGSLPT